MRGIFNETNANTPTGIPAIPAVQVQEKSETASDIMEMIKEETQPERPAVARRTPTPVEFPKIELTAQEILKLKLDKLNKEIFPIGGTVKDATRLKIIDGSLLAIMEITEDAKNNSMLSEFMTGDSGIRKMEDPDSPMVFAKNFRNGIYLVLKTGDGKLNILGGKYAEELNSVEMLKLYEKLGSTEGFLILSQKIEERSERKKANSQGGESPEKTGTNQ